VVTGLVVTVAVAVPGFTVEPAGGLFVACVWAAVATVVVRLLATVVGLMGVSVVVPLVVVDVLTVRVDAVDPEPVAGGATVITAAAREAGGGVVTVCCTVTVVTTGGWPGVVEGVLTVSVTETVCVMLAIV
jgi:hypothetical protein